MKQRLPLFDEVQPDDKEQAWPEHFADRLATWQQLLPRIARLAETVVGLEDCFGCGVVEGFVHHWGCEDEICPFCAGTLAYCPCAQQWAEASDEAHPFDTPVQEDDWIAHVEARGRVPYISYPVRCRRCGGSYGRLFMVPNAIWQRYVEPEHQGDVLCLTCFVYIVAVTLQASRQPLPPIGGQMGVRLVEAAEAADQETPK